MALDNPHFIPPVVSTPFPAPAATLYEGRARGATGAEGTGNTPPPLRHVHPTVQVTAVIEHAAKGAFQSWPVSSVSKLLSVVAEGSVYFVRRVCDTATDTAKAVATCLQVPVDTPHPSPGTEHQEIVNEVVEVSIIPGEALETSSDSMRTTAVDVSALSLLVPAIRPHCLTC